MGIKGIGRFARKTDKTMNDYISNYREVRNINIKEPIYVIVDFKYMMYKFLSFNSGERHFGLLNFIFICIMNNCKIIIVDEKSRNNMKINYSIKKEEEIKSNLEMNEIINENKSLDLDDINMDYYFQNLEKETKRFQKINKKNKYHSKSDEKKYLELLKLFKIPIIYSQGEADETISFLSLYLKSIDCANIIYSGDTDLLCRGCENVFYTQKGYVYEYNIYDIMNKLSLNYNSFVVLCCLLGSDYLKVFPNVNSETVRTIYYIVRIFSGNIEKIFDINNIKLLKTFLLTNYNNLNLTESEINLLLTDIDKFIDIIKELDNNIDEENKFTLEKLNNIIEYFHTSHQRGYVPESYMNDILNLKLESINYLDVVDTVDNISYSKLNNKEKNIIKKHCNDVNILLKNIHN